MDHTLRTTVLEQKKTRGWTGIIRTFASYSFTPKSIIWKVYKCPCARLGTFTFLECTCLAGTRHGKELASYEDARDCVLSLFYKSKAHNTCVFSNTQYTNLLYCLFFVDAPCVNVVLLMRSFLIWAQVSSPCQNLLTVVLEFKSFEPIDLSDRVSGSSSSSDSLIRDLDENLPHPHVHWQSEIRHQKLRPQLSLLAYNNTVTFSYFLLLEPRDHSPTPVLLPGKSHGWRSLVGCSPWGR